MVRPGTLSAIKPNVVRKKSTNEPNKIQTTLNFARIPKKSQEQTQPKTPQPEPKEKMIKVIPLPKEEIKTPPPKTPVTPKTQQAPIFDTPKSSTKTSSEQKKPARASTSRSQSLVEKVFINNTILVFAHFLFVH